MKTILYKKNNFKHKTISKNISYIMKLKMSKKSNSISGITLVSLVIIIVIMLILAGATITLALGKNGIIGKAQLAKEKTLNAQALENSILYSYENAIDNLSNPTKEDDNSFNIEYLNNFKKIYSAGIEAKGSGEYVIDKDYPMIIIIGDVIGCDTEGSAYVPYLNISVESSNKPVNYLIEKATMPYTSKKYRYYSTVSYIINPEIGTTIKWSAVYRGAVRVFALGSLDDSNN